MDKPVFIVVKYENKIPTFWVSGTRWSSEYPDAHVFESGFDAADKAQKLGGGAEAVGDYGLTTEWTVPPDDLEESFGQEDPHFCSECQAHSDEGFKKTEDGRYCCEECAKLALTESGAGKLKSPELKRWDVKTVAHEIQKLLWKALVNSGDDLETQVTVYFHAWVEDGRAGASIDDPYAFGVEGDGMGQETVKISDYATVIDYGDDVTELDWDDSALYTLADNLVDGAKYSYEENQRINHEELE